MENHLHYYDYYIVLVIKKATFSVLTMFIHLHSVETVNRSMIITTSLINEAIQANQTKKSVQYTVYNKNFKQVPGNNSFLECTANTFLLCPRPEEILGDLKRKKQ